MEHLFAQQAVIETLGARLKTLIAPESPGELRAWVVGCATGEDAYACAMLLREAAARHEPTLHCKLFATDTNPEYLTIARSGIYSQELLANLSPAHRQHFTRVGQTVIVDATIREQIIFATHELLRSPPFAHLDLIVCRQLFATFDPTRRAQALARFSYSLRAGGLLVLDGESSIDDVYFQSVDHNVGLYQRTTSSPRRIERAVGTDAAPSEPPPTSQSPAAISARLPALIIDAQWQIIQLGAGVEQFLQIRSGPLSYHLLDAIHPALREVVQLTIGRAMLSGRAAESAAVELRLDSLPERVAVIAQPPPGVYAGDGELMVLFETAAPPLPVSDASAERERDSPFAGLPYDNLLSRVEGENAVEELRVANEELRVLNEELHAATQELEARREELQTLNEELLAINQEQTRTMGRLERLNADMENLMASTDIGTLFLDRELRVQRYTPQMQTLFYFRPADLDRPLAHVTHQLRYPELLYDARRLLAELHPIEREVAHADGRWFLARLRPYQGEQGDVGGVVLTFLDISQRKRAEAALREAHAELERRVERRTAQLVQAHAARKALLREIVQAQERERLRIARDLHDQFGQQITAILLGLRTAQNEIAAESSAVTQLEGVRTIVQALGKELHQVASDLRPTALDDVGLAEALENHLANWTRRTGIMASFFETGVKHMALPSEIETTIYRVALEALTNIARHAEADQASLILEGHHGMVVLIVEDNGRGFDVEKTFKHMQQGEHMGLLGMHERVALIDGTLTVESTPGEGSTVIARIPLEQHKGKRDDTTPDSAGR